MGAADRVAAAAGRVMGGLADPMTAAVRLVADRAMIAGEPRRTPWRVRGIATGVPGRPRRWWVRAAVVALLVATPPAFAMSPDKRAALDKLFAALHAAPDEAAAEPLEDHIRAVLLRAGTPAVTLLMSRGVRALNAGNNDEAIEAFTDAITLDPDVAEAYHQRAIARWHAGDTPGAIADIEQTLRHEPRNFAALQTLTSIAMARQNWKGAYAAWQKVMELDPKTPGGADRLKDLRRRALGDQT